MFYYWFGRLIVKSDCQLVGKNKNSGGTFLGRFGTWFYCLLFHNVEDKKKFSIMS